jgi:hypothetical protein
MDRIIVKDFLMVCKAHFSTKRIPSFKQLSMRKRLVLSIFLVVIMIVIVILSQLLISLLIYESEVEIISSGLQSNPEYSTDYVQVSVNATLYNSGRPRGTTVWVEITDQPTNVSFSKTQYVQIEYREVKTLIFNFILDGLLYQGEFSHRTWLTYPNSQD